MARLNAWDVRVDMLAPPNPVPHPTDSRLYRVVMFRSRTGKHGQEYLYHIWPGCGLRRDLSVNDFPDEMRHHYSMVMASDVSARRGIYHDGVYIFHKVDERKDEQEVSMTVFSAPVGSRYYTDAYPEEFANIGWRVSQNIFCLVLTSQCLSSLRGETISNDTGSQGQEEGS